MSAATKKVRAAICRRAEGNCEACGEWVGEQGESGHLDHFFGRAKAAESVETCWLLCIACDDSKTNNRPGAAWWLMRFARHAEDFGFKAEAARARARLEVVQLRGAA